MSIQHDQPVHGHDIEIGTDVQPLEQSTSSMPITVSKPVTDMPLDKGNNKKIKLKINETVNM